MKPRVLLREHNGQTHCLSLRVGVPLLEHFLVNFLLHFLVQLDFDLHHAAVNRIDLRRSPLQSQAENCSHFVSLPSEGA